jgi:hypothetical protein
LRRVGKGVPLGRLSEDWQPTRWAEPDLHDWRYFIRPAELEREMAPAGLEVRDRVGIGPASLLAAVRAMREQRNLLSKRTNPKSVRAPSL